MPELPDIEELTEGLDPAAAAVVKVVYTAFRQLEKYLEQIQAENAELKRMLFGQRSERVVMPSAKREAAGKAKAAESEAEKAERKAATQRKRMARRAERRKLLVVEDRIEVPEVQRVCAHCDGIFRDSDRAPSPSRSSTCRRGRGDDARGQGARRLLGARASLLLQGAADGQ